MRNILISAGSAAIQAGMFLLCPYWLTMLVICLLLIPGMVVLAMGWQNLRSYVIQLISAAASIYFLGGVATAAQNLLGIVRIPIYLAIVIGILGVILLKTVGHGMRQQRLLRKVTITHCGTQIRLLGLYDSGNQLCYQGKSVHLVGESVLQALGIPDTPEDYIRYQAVGTAEGVLAVYYAQQIEIEGTGTAHEGVWLGKAEKALFEGKRYDMILHG